MPGLLTGGGAKGQMSQLPPSTAKAKIAPSAGTAQRVALQLGADGHGTAIARPSSATRKVSIGSAMFLTLCSPIGSKAKASLPLT